MPSITQDEHSAGPPPSKKRRFDDGSESGSIRQFAQQIPANGVFTDQILEYDLITGSAAPFAPFAATTKLHHHNNSPVARKIIAMRTPKRQRMSNDDGTRGGSTSPSTLRQSAKYQSPVKELQGAESNSRAQQHPGTTTAGRTQQQQVVASSLLNRCHICSRKPTKKTDLDDFADCEGCGQRTCYVCIRQCSGLYAAQRDSRFEDEQMANLSSSVIMEDADDGGFHEGENFGHGGDKGHGGAPKKETDGWEGGGHRQKICSRCCVERGVDGEVVCFGCLAFAEG